MPAFLPTGFYVVVSYLFRLVFAVCGLIVLILLIRVLLLLIRYLKRKLNP